jgi:hypothetical protein
MQSHLSLIKTGTQDLEKRVFPRFPFSYLLFKATSCDEITFEVKDISYTGMQICLKDGGHTFRKDESIDGKLNWRGKDLKIDGSIKWVKGQRIGVAFSSDAEFEGKIKDYLSIKNIVSSMRPLHAAGLELETPVDLKYWLQADGPVEVFVWQHNDGEISKFQLILMDSFIEYQDGKGLRSGRILTKRDLDTPLVQADEFVFEIDTVISEERLDFAKDLVRHIPTNFLPQEVNSYLKLKLGIIGEN